MRVGHTGRVLAVCVVHAELTVPGRVGRSAIDKRPVTGRVRAQRLGLAGDHVCNTRDHDGVHQAVYGYADEDAANWSAELGRELPVGWFGENLRIAGLPLSDAVIGARCTVGEAVLEVSGPRVPCATFGHCRAQIARHARRRRAAGPGPGQSRRARDGRPGKSFGRTPSSGRRNRGNRMNGRGLSTAVRVSPERGGHSLSEDNA
ncbi:MOSC domain-containing protein [Nocardia flavorosea]|uniref:MOSC domain-containing protein n=1 Tax=Nocardia flavorosea TaxID=53429 RepID=A0A846YDJ6_9NOCA|nr:MOSC domain-containing protein [Nocardia flavorosea]NKY55820.1 MOSC domain-containing protein [Nocardia flavorosea]